MGQHLGVMRERLGWVDGKPEGILERYKKGIPDGCSNSFNDGAVLWLRRRRNRWLGFIVGVDEDN